MRKLLLSLMVMMTMLTVQANDKSYTYLTFETTDEAKASVEMASLKLTFSGTTLIIGTQSFPISNLKKIYFSTFDESGSTGIESVRTATINESVTIYDLQGHKVTKGQMKRGVYIVKAKDRTYKMVFR
jgi:hypothetical protein